jgi:hypothetical protein
MVKDKSQPDGEHQPVDIHQVQLYRQLVLEYEALDEQIDLLLARHNGATEKMSDEDFESYRELAHHRDYIYNQMKALEQILLGDESEDSK